MRNEVMYTVAHWRTAAGLPAGCLNGSHCTLGVSRVGNKGRGAKGKTSLSSLWISRHTKRADEILRLKWLSSWLVYMSRIESKCKIGSDISRQLIYTFWNYDGILPLDACVFSFTMLLILHLLYYIIKT